MMIGAILSGLYLQTFLIQKDINIIKARYLAEGGAYEFLHYEPSLQIHQDTTALLNAGKRDSIRIKAVPFGGFLRLQSSATVNKQTSTVNMTFGELSTPVFEHAIVLGDTNSSINLIRNTAINGNIISGKQGVKESSFKGFPFRGSYDGESKELGKEFDFPEMHYQFISSQLTKVISGFKSNEYIGINIEEYSLRKEVNSKKGAKIHSSNDLVWLGELNAVPDDSEIVIKGNLTIDEDVDFGKRTRLYIRDTLLVNGSIEGTDLIIMSGGPVTIGGSSAFSGQVISKKEITLQENVYLKYPGMVFSSLEFLSGRDASPLVIHIKDNAIVDGTVVYPVSRLSFDQERLRVKVDPESTVRGAIYSRGQTELEGTVLGSVLTRQFYFYESPTSYINWLKDATIDLFQRPENYITPLGFSDSAKYAVVDWEVE